jgi:ABC-type glutathione transport system ATPase component
MSAAEAKYAPSDAPSGDRGRNVNEPNKPVTDKLAAYVNVLKREAELFGSRPSVEVKCDFSYTLSLPASKVDRDIVTVPEVFAGALAAPFKALAKTVGALPKEEEGKNAIQSFPVLQDVQCAFRPGEITLVLAPPGHGKTALLKAIAGALPKNAIPDNSVTYGGLTKLELEKRNISVNRMCAYVEQVDTHLPFLTVHETAKFSHENSTPAPAASGAEMPKLRSV